MTLVHVRLRVPSATGEAPAAGMLTCTPLLRRHLEDLDRIVLPAPFRTVLDGAGEADVELAPTGPDWCWQVREDVPAGIVRHVLVPDVATVDYGDLVDIDPTTLAPEPDPAPAWTAAVATVAADMAAAHASELAAQTAQGLAEAARDTAQALTDATVTTGAVVGDELVLTRTDGTTTIAGNVRGPSGEGYAEYAAELTLVLAAILDGPLP